MELKRFEDRQEDPEPLLFHWYLYIFGESRAEFMQRVRDVGIRLDFRAESLNGTKVGYPLEILRALNNAIGVEL